MTAILQEKFERRLEAAMNLIKEYGVSYRQIGIFGSFARGAYKGTSDIDICMIVDEHPPRAISGALREDCEQIGVDIVFVTVDYFNNSKERFAQKLRRDFREL